MIAKIAMFAFGSGVFALPVAGIVHILPAGEIHPLPLLRPEIVGVLIDREELVPVLDLSVCFPGSVAGAASRSPLHVVYEAEVGRVALPVDRVLQLVDCERGTVQSPVVATATGGGRKVFFYQGQDYPLLDIDELVAAPWLANATISNGIEEA